MNQNNIEWNIFPLSDRPLTHPLLWEKDSNQQLDKQILHSGEMMRVGKQKQTPVAYTYTLYHRGVLGYQKQGKERILNLDLSIRVKTVELQSIEEPNQLILAIRIQKYNDVMIYLWSKRNRNSTIVWYKLLVQYCLGENFEGLYQIDKTIDSGAYTSVYQVSPLVVESFQQHKYAAKVYTKEDLVNKIPLVQIQQFIRNECTILKKVKSDYIVKLLEVIQLNDAVMLIFEFLDGPTLKKISDQHIPEIKATTILQQLTLALMEIHSIGYVHRDVKLDNVILCRNDPIQVKLLDFGFSEPINRNILSSGQGTVGYIAPELFAMKPYTEQCDIFSLGVIYFTILSTQFPFQGQDYKNLLQQNKQCEIKFKQNCWNKVSSGAQRIAIRMLEKDPLKRLTLKELQILLQIHLQNLNKQNLVIYIVFIVEQDSDDISDQDHCEHEENSIDTKNIVNLQQSSNYYNGNKWKN